MIGRRRRVAVVILIMVVSATVVVWAILSRSARPVLTEEEVRLLISEHPSALHLEVKPKTIDFLYLELMPVEESPLAEDIKKRELPDKVWVVEFECYARVYFPLLWKTTGNPPPLFTRKFVRVVIDTYTGLNLSYHAEDVK